MDCKQLEIVLPVHAANLEKFAAQELVYFLKEISDIEGKLVREDEFAVNSVKSFVAIGKTELFSERSGRSFAELSDAVSDDGYRIVIEKNCALVCGGAGQGTIFGVYRLLKELFNLEIFTDDVYTFDKRELEFFDRIIEEKPDIPMRALGIYSVHLERRAPGIGNKRYCYRMRLRQMDEGWGINNHSFFRVLPPAIYKEKHPDWYDETGVTLCMSNEEMILQYAANMKKIIEDTPDDRLYMFGMEDTNVRCHCKKCRAVAEQYGGREVAVMLKFTNKLVDILNKWLKETHPERKVYFFTFAYHWAIMPPVEKTKNGKFKLLYEDLRPADNTGVLLAPLWSNASYPMNDPRNCQSLTASYHSQPRVPVRDIFNGWRSIVKHIAIWAYNHNFYDYMTPAPMWNGLDKNFRWFKKLNAIHVFMEAGCGIRSNFAEMKIYVCSQLMWDTSLSERELIKKFIGVYFAGAEKEIYGYFNYIHRHAEWLDKNLNRQMIFIHFDDDPNGRWLDARFWPKDVLLKCISYFDKAVKKKIPQEIKDRVLTESVPAKFTLLHLFRNELDKNYALALIDELGSISEKAGITVACNEPPENIFEFLAMWKKELNG